MSRVDEARTSRLQCARVTPAPAYDHAEITSIAASHVAYDLVALLALRK
ncbi:hypothetical protein GCM10022219_07760 [Microbacterium oryzae]